MKKIKLQTDQEKRLLNILLAVSVIAIIEVIYAIVYLIY